MLSKDEYQDLRYKCSKEFNKARRQGLIKPITKATKCVDCGEPAEMYEHRNYYKPLEVEPVCRSCNGRRGPGYPGCKEWGQTRAGNEGHIPDDVAFDIPLNIEFDYQAFNEHEEYLQTLPTTDPDVIRFDKEMNRMAYERKLARYTKEFARSKLIDGKMVLYKKKWNGEDKEWELYVDRVYSVKHKPPKRMGE